MREYRAQRTKQKTLAEVTMDGKASPGARRADGTRVHLLGMIEHAGRFLGQVEVDVKHNVSTHVTRRGSDRADPTAIGRSRPRPVRTGRARWSEGCDFLLR
jgi:hypothetical protein